MGVTTHPHVPIPEPIITCVVAAYYPDAAHGSPPIIKAAVYRTDTVTKQPGKRPTESGAGKLHPVQATLRVKSLATPCRSVRVQVESSLPKLCFEFSQIFKVGRCVGNYSKHDTNTVKIR